MLSDLRPQRSGKRHAEYSRNDSPGLYRHELISLWRKGKPTRSGGAAARGGLGRGGAVTLLAVVVGLCIFLGLGNIGQLVSGYFAKRAFDQQRIEVAIEHEDRLAVELAAQDSTLGVRFAEERGNLQELIDEGDSARAALADDLASAGIRIRQLTQVVAEARSELTAMANQMSVDTSETGEISAVASGTLSDGLLSGQWECRVPPGSLALEYGVRVPLEIVEGEGESGRTMVVARSPDPRVTLEVPAVFIDPPEPPKHGHMGLRGRWATIGGIVGYLLKR